VKRLLTIGVYGWHREAWLAALRGAGCDLVVDIRARRGVRGSEYAFANRARLEAALTDSGIAYLYLPEIAPPREARAAQSAADEASNVRKRDRSVLSTSFVTLYEQLVGNRVDWREITSRIDGEAPVLMCVERLPSACHRSVAATRLRVAAGVLVEDLLPG
jgi:uncharacterized protein (DUF488 family)